MRNSRNIIAIALLLICSLGLYLRLSRLGYLPPLGYFLDIFCFGECAAKENSPLPPVNRQLLNYNKSLAEIISTQTIDKSQISISIEKSQYQLTVYYQRQPIKSYPVVFGGNPRGDKLREGDLKTPEGVFEIRDLYPHSSWSKFLWIDYPNKDSWKKHLQAKREGKISWNTSIGGEIGIHGVPKGADRLVDERKNWTLGCISLKNKDVDELYEVVQVGTIVEIVP